MLQQRRAAAHLVAYAVAAMLARLADEMVAVAVSLTLGGIALAAYTLPRTALGGQLVSLLGAPSVIGIVALVQLFAATTRSLRTRHLGSAERTRRD